MGNGKILLFGFVSILIFIFPSSGLASLSCDIKTACDAGEVAVFKTSFITNAHAELPDQTNYPFNVCCGGVVALGNSCSASNNVAVLRLSGVTNAHVEETTYSNYPNPACLSAPETIGLTCGYSSSCSNLGSEYACLASISKDTNGHVGRCDIYPIKVCCSVLPLYDFDIRTITKIVSTVGEQFELKVEIRNVGASPDKYNIAFTSAFPNIIDISNPTPTTAEVQSEGLASVSTLIRPLTDGDNVITVNVASNGNPLLYKEITIPLKSAKLSLPEFGLFGFLQIVAIAAVLYFLVGNIKFKAN